MEASFRVLFNRKRQFFDVYLWDVHPNTFERWDAGRWAYIDFEVKEHPRRGKFADFHAVESELRKLRVDTVSHELDHIRINWMYNGDITGERRAIVSPYNEEWFCRFGDELIRKFYREYDKYKRSHR